MADSPRPHSRRPSLTSSSAHLRYPTFPPLSGSVEEWLSRSRPISMTSSHLADYTPRPLSESWATLSASDVHSEDGSRSEQTDVGSLIDQAGPDDVASIDEQYSGSEVDGNEDDDYDSKSNVFGSQELPALFPQIRGSIDDSNITTKTAFRQSTESIEFAEPEKWPEVEQVELKHTIRMFEGIEADELKSQFSINLRDSILTATVQQTMTKKSLDTDKPFRVLYIGDPEFRNIILDKIGDVLVSSTCSDFESSSTESSRYHVVPTSFGTGAVPNFAELLPIHVQLIVDECPGASVGFRNDKPDTIRLDFKNRPSCMSFWTGGEYCVSSPTEWTLPDVAILFISSRDSATVMETQKLARIFMERHGIPAMVISEKPLWDLAEVIPLNHHSLHMCLESRHSLTGKVTVLRRYPIDLATFESITPGQLNRNLASLVSISTKKSDNITLETTGNFQRKSLFAVEKWTTKMPFIPYLNDDRGLTPMLRLITLTVLLSVATILAHSALRATSILFSQKFPRSVISNIVSNAPSSTSTSIITANDLKQTSLSTLSSSVTDVQNFGNQLQGHSQLDNLMSGLLSPPKKQEFSGFEIQAVGDCHLVIKPPNRTLTGKKQPKFEVQVSRGVKPLEYELSRLFDGVYTLKLDRGDAYGIVNVTVTMASRPPLHQTTSVDFGTPWLKIANWRRAAQVISSQFMGDFNTAQVGLSEVYSRICTDLQVLMGDVVKKAHLLRGEANVLRHGTGQLSETKDVVITRSKQLSEVVRRTAVQPFLAVSSVLQEKTNKVNQETREIIGGTWHRISNQAHGFELKSVKDHIRNARKSYTLDKAQRRAKRLMTRKCRHSECL
ncbi:hypothetical protein F9C07_2165518 [Aspergillus flavus]|uniref:Uncharacterized protein n=4 Tax=Aspergillus subgen. Circumdati TaxID=2720871 RepID=A0A7G5KBG2_ASPFN|nr:uncharacterized protein G4B84_008602 [Aspergillus flavus NRRL3357]EIT82239.1 hypothetical protein Ao3042_00669 [Aspergillus oryzae 3.042]KDE83111.1 hypothetical protein AO1008_09744 [Aspergillus oryzae 100-8]OOO05424.1 hypothetical protein OAory_01069400 [Aspergillus oryzae]QMW45204.1 hypothetical protein G4B11_008624 [Aspergillus flavus]QMW33171.1 hypothetical protein G4B84_008602 [Aspergillus flavus NRRL3357]|eukprot:EIT82239.1 hypothetical protein Ao3042_00669 [Aspergillus oryzae 3.042]